MNITPSDPTDEAPPATYCSRGGKIALLSPAVRQELNRRLERGEIGKSILAWLNALPATREILQARFDGEPISQQNLSIWHHGGYQDWLRHEEDRVEGQALRHEAAESEDPQSDFVLGDHLANQMVFVYVRMLREIAKLPEGPEKWRHFHCANRELNQLRRVNHESVRLHLSVDRWAAECSATKQELDDEAARGIERDELRCESALLAFNDRFNAIEQELAVRQAAGEPVADDLRQLAIDRADLVTITNAWYANPTGLPGHHSYRPGRPVDCFADRFDRYVWKPKPAPVQPATAATAQNPPPLSPAEPAEQAKQAEQGTPPLPAEVAAPENVPSEPPPQPQDPSIEPYNPYDHP